MVIAGVAWKPAFEHRHAGAVALVTRDMVDKLLRLLTSNTLNKVNPCFHPSHFVFFFYLQNYGDAAVHAADKSPLSVSLFLTLGEGAMKMSTPGVAVEAQQLAGVGVRYNVFHCIVYSKRRLKPFHKDIFKTTTNEPKTKLKT